jgi:UPF0042 nucleotide-binding protein
MVRPLCNEIFEAPDQENSRIAIGIDTRTRGFSLQAVQKLVKDIDAHLLFISCDSAVLQRRFTETRRRHPMAGDKPVSYGIQKEADLLLLLQKKADSLIDTSDISIHDLRHILEAIFAVDASRNLTVSLQSFGFRGGVPREADIIMDVRFLRNPHWDEALKPKTGRDRAVGDYIRQDQDFEEFIENYKKLIEPLLPRYAQEGKSYLTIAFGCTGGRHRSVFMVEEMARWLEGLGVHVSKEHRDLS